MEIVNIPNPSDEQEAIISCFKQGYNIKIEAVAGSGKTTTLLHLALVSGNNFGEKSLILTYNKSLQMEIKKKLSILRLENFCSVYTYHGYASLLYGRTINNDKLLRENLSSKTIIKSNFRVILLDETQDLNTDYYNLISKILSREDILVLVGDRRQCINQYLNATADYLINYEKYFDTGRPWRELWLKTSYRLTPAIANFINKNILQEDLIIGGNINNENIKPTYNYCSWNLKKLLLQFVKIYGAEDIAILLPSTKSISEKSPLGKLMKTQNLGIGFCVKEDNELLDEVTKNKVIISNYHSFKGKEKACVFVLNFDESYFDYYCKTWPKELNKLPNELYVAASRAKANLILVQDENKPNFRTTSKEIITSTCNLLSEQKEIKIKSSSNKQYEVLKLIKNISTNTIIELMELIKVKVSKLEGEALNYDILVKFDIYFEDMRLYYGIIIPLIASFRLNEKSCLCNIEIKSEVRKDICERFNLLSNKKNKSIKEWMELVVIDCSINSKMYFYVDQITDYNWVNEKFIEEGIERLLRIIPQKGEFEVPIFINKSKYDYNVCGSVDYLTKNEIWEFKCVSSLIDQHKIQCAAYIALYYLINNTLLTGKLFNVKTNELIEITIDDAKLFMDVLLKHKK